MHTFKFRMPVQYPLATLLPPLAMHTDLTRSKLMGAPMIELTSFLYIKLGVLNWNIM